MEERVLKTRYQVDHLLLVQADKAGAHEIGNYNADRVEILSGHPGRMPRPAEVFQFRQRELNRFRSLLRDRRYDIVFFRYIVGTGLIKDVATCLPNAGIIVDVDMLASRIAQQAWQQNRSVRNRYFLFELLKLRHYEKRLFRRPYLLLMSNRVELEWAKRNYLTPNALSQLALVPNTMPEVHVQTAKKDMDPPRSYILFHGVLSSVVNLDAFRYLTRDIYPCIHDVLVRENIRVFVVGKGLSNTHKEMLRANGCSQVTLVGEVQDMAEMITNSLFCVIPLRIGSGTKTRVLECAAYGKAVVTTPIGAEGLELGPDEIVVQDNAGGLARSIRLLIENPALLSDMGANLQAKCQKTYAEDVVGRTMLSEIEAYLSQ